MPDADELRAVAENKLAACRRIAERSGGDFDPWDDGTPAARRRQVRTMQAAEGILAALLAIDARLTASEDA